MGRRQSVTITVGEAYSQSLGWPAIVAVVDNTSSYWVSLAPASPILVPPRVVNYPVALPQQLDVNVSWGVTPSGTQVVPRGAGTITVTWSDDSQDLARQPVAASSPTLVALWGTTMAANTGQQIARNPFRTNLTITAAAANTGACAIIPVDTPAAEIPPGAVAPTAYTLGPGATITISDPGQYQVNAPVASAATISVLDE
jgi:hypothetical protein